MKKILLILAVAGTFAACNNAKTEGGETPATDTAAKTEAPAPASTDTTAAKADTTAAAPVVDSTKK